MTSRLRSQHLWQLLERFPRTLLYRIGRAAQAPVNGHTYKHDLITALCALPEAALEQALVAGLAQRDLQALCKRIGDASTGSKADLAARILAALDDPAVHASRWRPFAEARAFAHRLELTSQREWHAFVRGRLPGKGARPADLPTQPSQAYAKTGWTTWGDFLGTGNVAQRMRTYRPFRQARAYARSLGLASHAEWEALCRARADGQHALPPDIPATPHQVYAGRGWNGYGDWLGTGRVRASNYQFRSYEEAYAFVRALGIRSQREWWAYCRGELPGHGPRPLNIPAAPDQVYRGRGWVSWGDFLGTGSVANGLRTYRPFRQARAYARSLGLASQAEWRALCRARSGTRRVLPPDIPSLPERIYAGRGWVGYGDWLGTRRVRASKYQYHSYEEACAFVRALGIRTQSQWRAYCRGELGGYPPRPLDVPSTPSRVYRGRGWVSWGHFVGTNAVATYKRTFRSFAAARAYARALGLHGVPAWRAWCAAGNRPADIPAAPNESYRGQGWVSWGDFLGTGNTTPAPIRDHNFVATRAFVRRLSLPTKGAFLRAKLDGRIPREIPMAIYRHPDWKGWADFLGPSYTGRRGPALTPTRIRGPRG